MSTVIARAVNVLDKRLMDLQNMTFGELFVLVAIFGLIVWILPGRRG